MDRVGVFGLVALLRAAQPGDEAPLRARLTLLAASPALGQPVPLRLELTNTGRFRITYVVGTRRLSDVREVGGRAGKRVPPALPALQTGEAEEVLDPGQTARLLDGLDLAESYHLA